MTHPARALWLAVEPIHALTYFSPVVDDALAAAGLRGFWMGYFAARAAPMGPVPASVVQATFYGFSPTRVGRAIPDAWGFAAPAAVLEARDEALAAALPAAVGDVLDPAALTRVLPRLEAAAAACDCDARPLAAAHLALDPADDPWVRLWQLTAILREHRGDGHNLALAVAGLDGCAANVLAAAVGAVPAEVQQRSRGWSDEAWVGATDALEARGLLDAAGAVTEKGRAWREEVEATTDRLAAAPPRALGDDGLVAVLADLRPAVAAVAASGVLPFPNPIGLPAPSS